MQDIKLPEEDGNYVYLLRCMDDTLYCGWTTNLKKRYQKHLSGKGAKYTRAHKPVELFYYECYEDASSARKREYEIKQLSREQKLKLKEAAEMEES